MEKRLTEQQIVFALRQAEAGTPISIIIRKMGVSEPTFYRRKNNMPDWISTRSAG